MLPAFPAATNRIHALETTMFRPTFAFVALTAALSAQIPTTTTSYPQESVQNNNGHLVPFGCITGGSFAEGHTQVLILPQYLPGPGAVLTALAVHCQGTLSLTYPSLNLTLSPTTITSLSTTFANNLTTPVPVLNAVNLTVNYSSNSWTTIAFTTPYVHDGVSGLVIDIEKVVTATAFATMSTTSNPGRGDLPPMVHTFGTPGSGANTATVAMYSASTLAVQLEWIGVPTIKLKSDPFGTGNNQFAVGGSIDHTLQGTPGSFFVNLIGLALNNPPLPLPPVLGQFWVNGPTMNLGLLPPSGSSTLAFAIPANPGLAGIYLAFQSLTADLVSSSAQFTNATDCFINN